jgi:D-alanyl-D-alanine carboxypeptidase
MKESKKVQEMMVLVLLWITPALFIIVLWFINPVDMTQPNLFSHRERSSATAKHIFDSIEIQGYAAIVQDMNSGEILYEKNSTIALPLASLTKIMTALVTHKMAPDLGGVFISSSAMRPLDGEKLYVGETFPLKQLVDYTLVTSSNDGAAAIADAVQKTFKENSFPDKMNQLAQEIGMGSTFYLNETGLDENESRAGAYGSARDVARLITYTLQEYPDAFEATKDSKIATQSVNGFIHNGANTNILAASLPNLIASKTGFTEIAGGNLAVVIDPALNRPVVIVVLGSTYDGRFTDVEALAKGVSTYFSLQE